MTPEDIKALTDAEVDALQGQLAAEQERRRQLKAIPARMDALATEYLTADGVAPGQEWVQPTGAHDSYPMGWQVQHNGKTWESLTRSNAWEPSVSGWREVAGSEGALAVWVQPTGAHDSYPAGAKVLHGSKVWLNNTPDNVWEPGIYGWIESA